MSNNGIPQSPKRRGADRRQHLAPSQRRWTIWEWLFGGFYNG